MIKYYELVFKDKKIKQYEIFKDMEKYKILYNNTQYEKDIFELGYSVRDGKYIYETSNVQHYQFGHSAK